MALQEVLLHCKPLVLALLALNVATSSTPVHGQSRSPSWDNCYGRHCEVGEYCGTNETFQSCRPCTNIAGWCNNTRYMEENCYPCLLMCKFTAAEGKMFELQNKTENLEAELRETEAATIVLKSIVGFAAALALIAVVVEVCSVRGQQLCWQNQDSLQTAIPSRSAVGRAASALRDKLILCVRCPAGRGRKPVRATSPNTSARYSIIRMGADDTGHQIGDESLACSGDVVLPNGGTAHDTQDVKDFTQNLPSMDNPNNDT